MTLLDFSGSPNGGVHKLLPEWQSQARITPTLILDHTIVGSGLGAWMMFRDSSGLESHFIVLGARSGEKDGLIWQCMDTDREADANLNANNKAISIETEDNGPQRAEDIVPWSPKQVDSLIWLHNKLASIYPTIKRQEVTSCSGSGLAYHSKMGAPSCWTPSAGKTCPGAQRIKQWKNIILPAFLQTSPKPLENDVSQADAEAAIRSIFRIPAGEKFDVPAGQTNLQKIFVGLLAGTQKQANSTNEVIAAINAVKTKVGGGESAVLAALATLDLSLSDADVTAIAAQVKIDEAKVAEAVRFSLSQALSS